MRGRVAALWSVFTLISLGGFILYHEVHTSLQMMSRCDRRTEQQIRELLDVVSRQQQVQGTSGDWKGTSTLAALPPSTFTTEHLLTTSTQAATTTSSPLTSTSAEVTTSAMFPNATTTVSESQSPTLYAASLLAKAVVDYDMGVVLLDPGDPGVPTHGMTGIFDYVMYAKLYDFVSSPRDLEIHFRDHGEQEGKLRYMFSDYEKVYQDTIGDPAADGGKFLATSKTLRDYIVWDRIPDCSCRSCHCDLLAFGLKQVAYLNNEDTWRSHFAVGGQIINFGNIFLSDQFIFRWERLGQMKAITRFVHKWKNSPVIEIKEPVFSFCTPTVKFFWHAVTDLLQFTYLYTKAGYNRTIVVNFSYMNDFIEAVIPSETRVITLDKPDPYLLHDVVMVKNFHGPSTLHEGGKLARSRLERFWNKTDPVTPVYSFAMTARGGKDVNNNDAIPGGPQSYYAWIEMLRGMNVVEFKVGKSGMKMREQMASLHNTKTLISDWGSVIANSWFMRTDSLMFILVYAGRFSQTETHVIMMQIFETTGVHLYLYPPPDNFDPNFAKELLLKVDQVIHSEKFSWKTYLQEVHLEDLIETEWVAINLHLRQTRWFGSEQLPIVNGRNQDILNDPRVRAVIGY